MLQGLFVQLASSFQSSRSSVPSTLWNGSALMFWIKECIFTCWEMKTYVFKNKVAFCKGMLLIEKESSFRLRNATTLWMKVSVCKACSCYILRIGSSREGCMFGSSLVVIYSVFTALFRFAEKTQSWIFFHVAPQDGHPTASEPKPKPKAHFDNMWISGNVFSVVFL